MGRFNRFLHLERERPAQPAQEGEPSSPPESRAARFDAVQTPGPAQGDAPNSESAPDLPRFENKPREGELSLHLDRAEDQPFIRCRVCEGDSNRFARECVNCHADLDTPEQRAFNEKLWAGLRAQKAEEAEAHARAQEERLKAAEEEARQKRALFEQMARDVRRQAEADIAARMGESTVTLRGRRVKVTHARYQFAALGVVVLVLMTFAGAFGSCRAAAGILPLALIAAGVIALRRFLR